MVSSAPPGRLRGGDQGQALRLPGLCPLAEEGVGGGNELLHLQAQLGDGEILRDALGG